MSNEYVFTSESVTEGHPDKVCDTIADSILDACLAQDRQSRVACEVLCKENQVVLAGEITTRATLDFADVARRAIREIGYDDPAEPFCADTAHVHLLLSRQSPEISQGVEAAREERGRRGSRPSHSVAEKRACRAAPGPRTDGSLDCPARRPAPEQGAGDQGIMFGYATAETRELMPLPILLAHRLARGLAEDRRRERVPWLRPDGKTQVSVRYEDGAPREVTEVVVSTQHRPEAGQAAIRRYVQGVLAPRVLGRWMNAKIRFHVNPTGSFVKGGPSADCGVTGRKIIVDTYGGMARHGGGAFSGKDPSKVDRSAAYFCRYVARQVVRQGLARRAELQVSYAIGEAQPLSVLVNTFETGDAAAAEHFVRSRFDFRPGSIIEQLDLLRPIYRKTTNYGHFGRPGLPWEK